MRWLMTFALAALVAGGASWLAFGGKLAGPGAVPVPASLAVLKAELSPTTIRKIERSRPGSEPLTLLRDADGGWTQPGNWPVRRSEADTLANTLAEISTRFQPQPIAAATDLTPFGLDPSQNPVTIKVTAATKPLTLLFGQAAITESESAFARPTWLRIDDQPELLRLGPDVFTAITRTVDDYRRRQLIPGVVRVKLVGGEPPPNPMTPAPAPTGRVALPTDQLAAIKVDSPLGGYTLKRVAAMPAAKPDPDRPSAEASLTMNAVADVWEMAESADTTRTVKPLRDHLDPAKLRGILTAIPEIWAESFITGKSLAEMGLEKPERSITLNFEKTGTTTVLQIGKLARSVTK
jgi:hypothetical protein